jgi:ribA/ribD-fused uncharacterized protein
MKLHQITDGTPEIIAWFDDFDGDHPYVALSNFYQGDPIWIPFLKESFATGEHAFAAMKTDNQDDFLRIQLASTPGAAKMLGRSVRLRKNWEEVKYDAMMAVIRCKFTTARPEGDILLSTGDALLIEGTYWDDEVWGVALRSDDADPTFSPGRNWLGTMLMARRAELKAEKLFRASTTTAVFNAQFARR